MDRADVCRRKYMESSDVWSMIIISSSSGSANRAGTMPASGPYLRLYVVPVGCGVPSFVTLAFRTVRVSTALWSPSPAGYSPQLYECFAMIESSGQKKICDPTRSIQTREHPGDEVLKTSVNWLLSAVERAPGSFRDAYKLLSRTSRAV
jgi:hypothetical protein